MLCAPVGFLFFFFKDTATTEIYPLSLHDALPIYRRYAIDVSKIGRDLGWTPRESFDSGLARTRSEEHTSELQSLRHLVCRLLLEKKKPSLLKHKRADRCQAARLPHSRLRHVKRAL